MRLKDGFVRRRAIQDALANIPLDVLRIRYGSFRKKSVIAPVYVEPDDELARLLVERVELQRRLDRVETRIKALMNDATQEAASTVQQAFVSDNPTSPIPDGDELAKCRIDSASREHARLNHLNASVTSTAPTRRRSQLSRQISRPAPRRRIPQAFTLWRHLKAKSRHSSRAMIRRSLLARTGWRGPAFMCRPLADPDWSPDDLAQLARIDLIKYWAHVPTGDGFVPYAVRVLERVRNRIYERHRRSQTGVCTI